MQKLNMTEHKTNGLLFTFCGLDGCGKTTMITKLVEQLKDYDCFVTKQPTDDVRNSKIFRTYQDSPEHDDYDYRSLSLMAASDRIQHTNHTILPQLKSGKIVISDRYIYSCLANLRARGYTKDKWIYEISKSIIKPDIAFFFDVPVDVAVTRVRSRKEEQFSYIDMELQHKLQKEYKDICKANHGVLVPTDISIEETFNIVLENVKKVLEEKNGNRIKSN